MGLGDDAGGGCGVGVGVGWGFGAALGTKYRIANTGFETSSSNNAPNWFRQLQDRFRAMRFP